MNKDTRPIHTLNSRGFTLLEVLIVIALFSIMAAIAIPSILVWAPDLKLKSAARDVFSTLQRARILAVKAKRNTAVIFDPTNNEYQLCDDWDTTGSTCAGNLQTINLSSLGYGIGYGHGNATQDVPGGAFPADNVSYGSPVNTAVLNSRGLGNAGYVYLDHQENSTTYAIGNLTSGSIRILKWNGSVWK